MVLKLGKLQSWVQDSATPVKMACLDMEDDKNSVADPECLSRIPDTDFYPSRITHPTRAKKGGGNICCLFFFSCHKFYKIENYFIFEQVQAVLWIHIGFIADPYPVLNRNPVSDPNPLWLITKKSERSPSQLKKIYIFLIKNCNKFIRRPLGRTFKQ